MSDWLTTLRRGPPQLTVGWPPVELGSPSAGRSEADEFSRFSVRDDEVGPGVPSGVGEGLSVACGDRAQRREVEARHEGSGGAV